VSTFLNIKVIKPDQIIKLKPSQLDQKNLKINKKCYSELMYFVSVLIYVLESSK